MNDMFDIWYVDADEWSRVEVIDPEIGGPTEYYEAVELIAAKSRGQARAIMARANPSMEFTHPMKIKRIVCGAHRDGPGIITDGDEAEFYWTLARLHVATDVQFAAPGAEPGGEHTEGQ